jgi:ATP-dependent phosphofructokinase / diphosphate-dependent phosphofructokinase
MSRRIGILTGGGDATGLNGVIRAFTRRAEREHGWEVVGVRDSFNGLLTSPRQLCLLSDDEVRKILAWGGTILGTTNRGDPFDFPGPDGRRDRSAELAAAVRDERLDGLVVIGGDGTQKIALRLMREHGVPVVGVPKTIDNDLSGTDFTFGFQSAVDVATEALDRLHTTAESHERVMVLEVMGRDTGHIALHAGLSGAADAILIPEIAYDPARVVAKIQRRQRMGRSYSIVVIAEGCLPQQPDGSAVPMHERSRRLKAGGGAAAILMATLEGRVDAEMRATVLGHLQRGGSPVPSDRLLATRFGAHAADLVGEGRWGRMVRLRDGSVDSVPLEEAAHTRFVALDDELVGVARQMLVELGG